MAGKEMSQKRKKHMKSRVFVPEDSGKWLAKRIETRRFGSTFREKSNMFLPRVGVKRDSRISFTLGHIARSMTLTQLPPMLA